MVLLFGAITCVLAVWLIVSPFLFGYGTVGIAVAVCGGVLAAVFAYLVIKQRKPMFAQVNAAVGVVVAIAGIYLVVTQGQGINLIVTGILIACVSFLTPPFMIKVKTARFGNKGGNELAKVSAVKMKDENIIAKVVMLGSMPETIYIKPGEFFKVLTLIDDEVIKSIFKFMVSGYKIAAEDAAKEAAAEAEKEAAKKAREAARQAK